MEVHISFIDKLENDTLLFLLRRLQAPARHLQGRSGNRINKIHIYTLINEDLHEVEIRLVASDVQRATSTTLYNVKLSFSLRDTSQILGCWTMLPCRSAYLGFYCGC